MLRNARFAVAVLFALAACGSDPTSLAGDAAADSGMDTSGDPDVPGRLDSAVGDARGPDSGVGDAASVDGASEDGTAPDAGPPPELVPGFSWIPECTPFEGRPVPGCAEHGTGPRARFDAYQSVVGIRVSVLMDDRRPTRVHISGILNELGADSEIDCLEIEEITLSDGGSVIQQFVGGGNPTEGPGFHFESLAPANPALEQLCAADTGRAEAFDTTIRGWVAGRPFEVWRPRDPDDILALDSVVTCHRNHPSWPSPGPGAMVTELAIESPATYDIYDSVGGRRGGCFQAFDPSIRFIPLDGEWPAHDSSPWGMDPRPAPLFPESFLVGVEFGGVGNPVSDICGDSLVHFITRLTGVANGRPVMTEVQIGYCSTFP